MKKVLFIDRDGTMIVEPAPSFQIDSFEKLEFIPGMIGSLNKITSTLNFELAMWEIHFSTTAIQAFQKMQKGHRVDCGLMPRSFEQQ